jgi:hypothetical protein
MGENPNEAKAYQPTERPFQKDRGISKEKCKERKQGDSSSTCSSNHKIKKPITMNRKETLELLIEIEEAIEYFEHKINEADWSDSWGLGSEFESIRKKNMHNIVIYTMCIGRLNERFTKQLNTLK